MPVMRIVTPYKDLLFVNLKPSKTVKPIGKTKYGNTIKSIKAAKTLNRSLELK